MRRNWFNFRRKARGEGQGTGGDRQGDGGADLCVCPKCGAEKTHDRGTPCLEVKCPKCGAAMVGKEEKASLHKPYATIADLPPAVRKLPKHGQEIYLAAFNAAYEQYDGDEDKAHATAWAAVKTKYERVDGEWVSKSAVLRAYLENAAKAMRKVETASQNALAKALGIPNLEGTYEARLRSVGDAVQEQWQAFGGNERWNVYAVATTETSVIVEAKDRYWLVPYVMENGEVVLGMANKRQVEIASEVVPVRQAEDTPWIRLANMVCDDSLPIPWEGGVTHRPGEINWYVPIAKADDERRLVYGVVLWPGDPKNLDAQQDFIKAEEIELSAHDFMKQYRRQRATMGLQHEEEAAVDVVESYIAPADFTLNKQEVQKDSWVLVAYVRDEDMWKAVKAGELTGFSIGGEGERVEAE